MSLNDKYCEFNFDEYGLMLFYAKKLNETRALNLYKSTTSEYIYKLLREIPVGSLSSGDETVAIMVSEMSEVVNFIDTEIILPSGLRLL